MSQQSNVTQARSQEQQFRDSWFVVVGGVGNGQGAERTS